MSLHEVVTRRAFEPATEPVALARSHERFDRLSGADPERELFAAITADTPCAAEIRGPAGSGKSSCIMRVVGDVARLDGPPRYEVLLLRAGDAEDVLGTTGEFALHLVQLVRSQGFNFAAPVQERLRTAGAEQTTVKEAVRTHTGTVGADAKILRAGYQHALQEAYAERKYGQSAPQSRHELEDILAIVRAEGVRPVVVIDDTDKFADAAPDGLNVAAVDGLFDNGIRTLSDLGLDFVVAVHPRFQDAGAYDAVAARALRTRLEIPWLDLERRPIAAILAKHLQAHGIESAVGELITEGAQTALWGAYSVQQNVRHTLEAAHRGARIAQDRGSDIIEDQDVSSALRDLAG